MKKLYNYYNRIRKYPNIEYIILSIIIILGFSSRLYKINNPIADWHSFRQADTASVTRFFIDKKIDLLHPVYHDISRIQSGLFNPNGYRFVEFPIYNLIQALLVKIFPIMNLEVWGRLVSIFSALGSAYILFLLGKKYISVTGGLIAAAFYLFNPYNIYFTRVILPEPLAVFFALLAMIWFVNYSENHKIGLLYLSAISFSLSLLIKPYTIFFSVPVAYILFNQNSLKKIFTDKHLMTAFLLAAVPLLLWRLWMRQYPEGIPFWKWTFNGDGIRFMPAYWYWLFGERLTKLILGYWGIIPFFFGLISYNRKNLFINYFISGMFLFAVVIATANVRHDYYQSITIPAIALVYSLGFIKLWELKTENKIFLRILLLFSVFITLITGAFQVKEYYKINHPEIIAAGKAVERLTPKDSLIIAAYNGDTAFLYQTGRRGWPNVELPINELIDEGASYYASVNLNDSQTQEFESKFKILEKTGAYVILDLKQK